MAGLEGVTGFWSGRRVFLTGHTGFKGSWLSMWLHALGADVHGYALDAPTTPSLFEVARVAETSLQRSSIGDIRDRAALDAAMQAARPEIVFHLAAQSLVLPSYADPVETYAVNVLGTVHLLEAVRRTAGVRAVVIVTSDKCYENREWEWGYREHEPMGGFDPYSSSKGCTELVTSAYRRSFLAPAGVALASARAGNVIGGGDWARDRLIPDVIRAFEAGVAVPVRNPRAVRPWQHVLEPLSGYLRLAEELSSTHGSDAADGWNFGPDDADARPVAWVVSQLVQRWGEGASWQHDENPQAHEATYLKLDCSKAHARLDWRPRWSLTEALDHIVSWHKAYRAGKDMHEVTHAHIEAYSRTPKTAA